MRQDDGRVWLRPRSRYAEVTFAWVNLLYGLWVVAPVGAPALAVVWPLIVWPFPIWLSGGLLVACGTMQVVGRMLETTAPWAGLQLRRGASFAGACLWMAAWPSIAVHAHLPVVVVSSLLALMGALVYLRLPPVRSVRTAGP